MSYVARAAWGSAYSRASTLLSGSRSLTVHWNGPRLHIDPNRRCDCEVRVRSIQRFHVVSNRWADVAYNWLVCPHGTIFEGRGWGRRSAANGTNAGNAHGHAVMVLIGEGETPSPAALSGLARLRAEHNSRYSTGLTLPHSHWKATACPGPHLTTWAYSPEDVEDPNMPLSDADVERVAEAAATKVVMHQLDWLPGSPSLRAVLGRIYRDGVTALVPDPGRNGRPRDLNADVRAIREAVRNIASSVGWETRYDAVPRVDA